ncbi:hypothetical protein SCUCBS95973_003370 [Sporothrix curviconia]|uniref:HNH nuclease domain-containing protein n=1 Tax=Sporothrix curviconia TaxID=1260050 RepID=A0ABP0BEX4_9PEZI
MAAPSITVSYVGRFPINWAPHEHGMPSSDPSPAPRTHPRFIEFLSRSLEKAKANEMDLTAAKRAERITFIRLVLERAQDPNGRIQGVVFDEDVIGRSASAGEEDIEDAYDTFLNGHMRRLLESGTLPWKKGKKAANEQPGDDNATRRDAADLKAQKDVPALYNHRCVLTGTTKPEGAHIVPVRAKNADHDITWRLLRMFWPLRRPDDVTVPGKEHMNILPLTQTAHTLFDAYHFALRPIAHPQTPSTRIFLQVVYLRDTDGQRIDTRWDHRRFGGLFDFRRAPLPTSTAQHEHECPAIQHGDLYELFTDDPIAHPLPSERLLQVQYGMHQIMSGMCAAGALRDTFDGTPPPDNDGDSPLPSVPDLWAVLIQEAQDLGILDADAAALWGREFARQARADAEEEEALHEFIAQCQHGYNDDSSDIPDVRDQEDGATDHGDEHNGKGKDIQAKQDLR